MAQRPRGSVEQKEAGELAGRLTRWHVGKGGGELGTAPRAVLGANRPTAYAKVQKWEAGHKGKPEIG